MDGSGLRTLSFPSFIGVGQVGGIRMKGGDCLSRCFDICGSAITVHLSQNPILSRHLFAFGFGNPTGIT